MTTLGVPDAKDRDIDGASVALAAASPPAVQARAAKLS
jgi:hypothetical protein